MVTCYVETDDSVWRAICDGRRRFILDTLSRGPKSTGELVDLFPRLGRTAVLKHIGILLRADLIDVRREGRVRWNYLNSAPIRDVCGGWTLHHIEGIQSSAEKLKRIAEHTQ